MKISPAVRDLSNSINYGIYHVDINAMRVYIGLNHVGDIRGYLNGWHYVPVGKTQADGGTLYQTIQDVKDSLEEM